MPQSAAQELASLINRLQNQRQQHLDAIANIDATFEQFGIATGPAKKHCPYAEADWCWSGL